MGNESRREEQIVNREVHVLFNFACFMFMFYVFFSRRKRRSWLLFLILVEEKKDVV